MAVLKKGFCATRFSLGCEKTSRRPRFGAKCPEFERYFLSLPWSCSRPVRASLFARQIVAGLVEKPAANSLHMLCSDRPDRVPKIVARSEHFCSTLPTITVDYYKTYR